MIEQKESESEKNFVARNLKDNLKMAAIILVIVAAGFLLVNQFLGFIYKNQLAMQPCDLCVKLNPNLTECLYPKARASYPDGRGGWTDPFKENHINITLP